MNFSQNGKHLAVGDYGGRCIVFESVVDEASGKADYEYFLEFQSHHKAIDFYSNQEIPDMITQICWLKEPSPTSLLTSNSRTIKLWKLQQKFGRKTEGAKRICKKGLGLVIPKREVAGARPGYMSKLCHTFKSNFAGNLHSLSPSTDSLNFLSADEKCINLWNLENLDNSAIYSLVDLSKPQKEMTNGGAMELISSACFNQFTKKDIFLFTTSIGGINVCDLRERSNF
jgi:WD40 repeat protein